MQKRARAETDPDLPALLYIVTATFCAAIAFILLALVAVGGDSHGMGPGSTIVTD